MLASTRVAQTPRGTADERQLRLGYIAGYKLGLIVIIGSDKHPRGCVVCRIAMSHKVYSRLMKTPPLQPYHLVTIDAVTVTSEPGQGKE